jgi:hypothetical protein
LIAFTRENHLLYRLIECVCPDDTARQRLEVQVAAASHPATNRNYGLYLELKSRSEPIPPPKLVIDTSQPFTDCLQLCLDYVREENCD